ncbi:hypothetical protein LZ30DRAFT_698775 [Colletotrichum cereale]|nr:hypothetical protein LZ30DRAFT_698775 [Colletotrichum cereale]
MLSLGQERPFLQYLLSSHVNHPRECANLSLGGVGERGGAGARMSARMGRCTSVGQDEASPGIRARFGVGSSLASMGLLDLSAHEPKKSRRRNGNFDVVQKTAWLAGRGGGAAKDAGAIEVLSHARLQSATVLGNIGPSSVGEFPKYGMGVG